MVLFIVNVVWGNEYLFKMLEVFKKYYVKVIFFLEGKWVKNNSDMVKMIVDVGYEVGNYFYFYFDMVILLVS